MTSRHTLRGVRGAAIGIAIGTIGMTIGTMPAAAQSLAPRIFLDQPLPIIEYQLNRLTPEQLPNVERRDDDPRYRPVYMAFLLRDRVQPAVRDEAVSALVKLGGASRSHVLLEALARLAPEAEITADQLTRLLVAQPVDDLRRVRGAFIGVLETPAPSMATRAAYGALVLADPDMASVWALAAGKDGHRAAFLRGLAVLPPAASFEAVRARAWALVSGMWTRGEFREPERPAAVLALGALGRGADVLALVAPELASPVDAVRQAAVRVLSSVPIAAWPEAAIAPAIEAVAAFVRGLPPGARTAVAVTEALGLADALTARLPAAVVAARRAEIRSLGAQVVRIAAVFEQVSFDVRWFAVQAGRPVQIVFVNPEAMPHNIVIGRPGALEEIGTAASAMAPSADPGAKPYVPALPSVLFSTRLVQQGETERLSFVAPSEPGAYVFACTFPGHWTRMYGVMLVVNDLAAFEAAPRPPIDPRTKQPFATQTWP